MRRFLILLICAHAAVSACAAGWDEVLAARLEQSADYLEARLNLKAAEVALSKYAKPYIPTIALSTAATGPLSVTSSGFSMGTWLPSLSFENILGADISFQAAVGDKTSKPIGIDSMGVSITRNLFEETSAERLDAEAAMKDAKARLRSFEHSARLQLATDILDAMYYKRMLESSMANRDALNRVLAATVDAAARRQAEKNVLDAQKSVMNASNSYASIPEDVRNNLDSLFADIVRLFPQWTAFIKENPPETSLAIQALELYLMAAEKRAGLVILPYLPDSSLKASLSYEPSTAKLTWGLAVSMSFTAMDKGQRELNSLKREEYPKIYRIKLEESRKALRDSVRQAWQKIESLSIDASIAEIEIAEAEENLEASQRLHKEGFLNDENLELARVAVSFKKLKADRSSFDIMVQKLKLADFFDSSD